MVFSRTKLFYGRIYALYERHPLLMNSIMGGLVYVAGELIVELQSSHDHFMKEKEQLDENHATHVAGATVVVKDKGSSISFSLDSKDDEHVYYLDKINWSRVLNIGVLGVVQNGAMMLMWYRLLAKTIGSNARTLTVVIKCILDQVFFATQQDAVFLAYCGYLHSATFDTAWKDMTDQFLTTWINDCSLWPIVNFIGFAYVPTTLQPTYMSIVQLFWQIYISSMAVPKPITKVVPKEPVALLESKSDDQHCSICENKFPHMQDYSLQHVKMDRMKPFAAQELVNRTPFATSPAAATFPGEPIFRWFHSNDPDRMQALRNAKYSFVTMTGLVVFRSIVCRI